MQLKSQTANVPLKFTYSTIIIMLECVPVITHVGQKKGRKMVLWE